MADQRFKCRKCHRWCRYSPSPDAPLRRAPAPDHDFCIECAIPSVGKGVRLFKVVTPVRGWQWCPRHETVHRDVERLCEGFCVPIYREADSCP